MKCLQTIRNNWPPPKIPVGQEPETARAVFVSDILRQYPSCNRPSATFHSCQARHIDRGSPNRAQFTGSFYSLTGSMNGYPHSNMTIRPEVRYMNAAGNTANYVGPQFNGQLYNQTVYGVDAILTF